MGKWKSIVLHHSLTKDSKSVSWNAIRKYHTDTLGWQDIGYNFGIENINGNFEILAGRPLNINGAHTRGKNRDSIGICFVGNYDLISPPEKMLFIAGKFIKGLCFALEIPHSNIKGHKDFSNKSCPGKMFDIDSFIESHIR